MQKPNLFTYATSELSQDAIICWLLEWGRVENKELDQELHQIGKLFLDSIFHKFDDIERPSQYHTIEIVKQYKNIDVFCIINNEYAIIIEDKTNTKNHSKQLEKYLNEIKKKFEESKILPVYFKTGDQGDYSEIIEKGYRIYLRKDFLEVLDQPFKNDILNDYDFYLQKIENSVNSYQVDTITSWSWSAGKGFYIALKKELKEGNWGYVSNASGGFLGFWWNFNRLDGYNIYMQIENSTSSPSSFTLKFKLSSGTKEKVDRSIINKWKKHIDFENEEFRVTKPRVVRAGRWTTIGILDNEFRITNMDERVNISKTVENIKKIEQILSQKIESIEVS